MSPVPSLPTERMSKAVCALRTRLAGARQVLLAAVSTTVILALAACGSSQPRTQVLRSANPLSSDIYVRITGPGGAVSYVAQLFVTAAFSKYRYRKVRSEGSFLPPQILERKLCSSTHIIRRGDAQALQRWRGRKLAITVYGKKTSAIFCSVFGPEIYQEGS
jgi:hypothetical protein